MNTSPLINQVHQFIKEHHLIPSRAVIIVGFSGGPDSVFLLHVLASFYKQGLIKLIAAHLDHEWRSDSAQDTIFCKKIADDLDIPFISAQAHTLYLDRKKYKGSQEALGRALRRTFLQQLQKEHHADRIALAHHLDDQEETFFIRLIRGTSLAGLCGMRPRTGDFIRPLLDIKKSSILTYLHEHNIAYLEDPTNTQPQFLRNRIRATVIPALRAVDNRFDDNFLATISRLQDIDHYLTTHTRDLFNQLCVYQNSHTHINLDQLLALPHIMQDRLFMYWLIHEHVPFVPTAAFLEEIRRFLQKSPYKTHAIHQDWHIHKSQNRAYITKNIN